MKLKELKRLASSIAALELVIEENKDQEKVDKAKQQIMKLTKKVQDPNDLFSLDELIQEILKEKKS